MILPPVAHHMYNAGEEDGLLLDNITLVGVAGVML